MTVDEMRNLGRQTPTPDGESLWSAMLLLTRAVYLSAAEICERLEALQAPRMRGDE